ncbi:FtsW-like protein [Mycobacterium tuberculosis]|nr:FtsW-like protein [Mycobacterium tuberculosis]
MLTRLLRRGTSDTDGSQTRGAEPVEGQRTGPEEASNPGSARPRTRFGAWLGRPMTSFHLIIAVAALLTTLGLIMVLSASAVRSYDDDGSAWVIFGKQVLWTLVGLIGGYVCLRMSVRFMRRIAFSGFAITIVMLVLVLVPGIGKEANGSRGWFVVAGFSMQPSELAKMAFAIWGAHLLAARRMERASLREMLIPLVPAAVVALALIVAQPDLGQTVSMGIILLGLLWYAGLPLRVFLSSLAAVVVSAAILAVSAGYRSDRVRSWLNPENDPQDSGYQARQAKFALAQGGIFGDGLGQGVAKWNYLPNAHNDFIFAIIGEELGLVGALGLLGLFGLFAYTGMRIASRSARPVPAAADRHHDTVGAGTGVHQHRLCDRAAARHRPAAAAHLRRWNLHGRNTFADRHHRQRGSPRTGGGGRAAGWARRQGEPVAAAAAARAVSAPSSRGVS